MKKILYILSLALWPSLGATAQELAQWQAWAAEANPEVQAHDRALEAALQHIATVNQLPEPTLSLGVFVLPIETRVGPQQFRASLSQRLPWFGELQAREDVATHQAEARYAQAQDVRARLYVTVAETYYALAEVEALLALERQHRVLLERTQQLANQRIASGEASLSASLKVDLQLADSQLRIENLEARRAPLAVALKALAQRPDGQAVEVDSLAAPAALALPPYVLADTLHPQWQRLEGERQAAQAQAVLAAKQGMPQFGVGLDYVAIGLRTDMPTLVGNGRDALAPGVQISIPIHRSRYAAAVQEAQLRQQEKAYQQAAVLDRLRVEYARLANTAEEQARRYTHYQAQVQKAERIVAQLLAEYGNDQAKFEDILDWQAQQLQYQKEGVKALVGYTITLQQLTYITANPQ